MKFDLAQPGRQWAVSLMRREAGGESIAYVARIDWRIVLGFAKDIKASDALDIFERKSA